MKRTLKALDDMARHLHDELENRLEASADLLAEAKDFAGEPSGLTGNHDMVDLANGLLQSAITYGTVGRVTSVHRQSLEM